MKMPNQNYNIMLFDNTPPATEEEEQMICEDMHTSTFSDYIFECYVQTQATHLADILDKVHLKRDAVLVFSDVADRVTASQSYVKLTDMFDVFLNHDTRIYLTPDGELFGEHFGYDFDKDESYTFQVRMWKSNTSETKKKELSEDAVTQEYMDKYTMKLGKAVLRSMCKKTT
jgi:hypothetical protein